MATLYSPSSPSQERHCGSRSSLGLLATAATTTGLLGNQCILATAGIRGSPPSLPLGKGVEGSFQALRASAAQIWTTGAMIPSRSGSKRKRPLWEKINRKKWAPCNVSAWWSILLQRDRLHEGRVWFFLSRAAPVEFLPALFRYSGFESMRNQQKHPSGLKHPRGI